MSWRKCLVRGLVLAILAGLASAVWLYQRMTSPPMVRQQVVAKLGSYFRATHIRLDAASLRLLGGISFSDLRLIRQHDPDQQTLLYVPNGIIYHDKEQLLDGKLAIRKVELYRPRLHLVRQRDGTWNTDDLLGPTDLNEPVPTLVIHRGTVLLEDRLAAPDAAPVEIQDVHLTILNDPLPRLVVRARGTSELLGPLQVQALLERAHLALALTVEAPQLRIGPNLTRRLAGYCPELGGHAQHLRGLADVRLDLGFQPAPQPIWSHDVRCRLTHGQLDHPQVPLPLTDMEATLRCTDGRLRLETFTARSGMARLEARGSAQHLDLATNWEGELKATRVPVTAQLFARLPEELQEIHADFAPEGTVDLLLQVSRWAGKWRRHTVVTTNNGRACPAEFPYPLQGIRGRIEERWDEASALREVRLDLVGQGSGGRPIHVQGTVRGHCPDVALEVDVWGDNLPLDDQLRQALEPEHQELVRAFQPTGLADFRVKLRRQPGEDFANHIHVRFHDATIRYEVFPYPLEKVSGVLDIWPDHWEFREFRGSRKGGEFRAWARSQPVPGTRDRITLHIEGKQILLDEELEAALAPKLQAAWKAVAPGGRMDVEAHIDQLPDRPENIAVTVTAHGCTLQPTFFPYLLSEVSGTVRYAHGKVDLEKFTGRHGNSTVALERGQVFLKPAGGFWARFSNLQGKPLIVDDGLLTALPPVLKKIGALIEPNTPLSLATELVIDMPAEPNLPPDLFWDGGLAVHEATLHVGVPVEQVRGQVWCQGRHDGRQLQGLKGNLLLSQAVLFGQPFREVHSHLLIAPESPEVLRLPNLKARIFGGDLGGEVRVEFGPTIHYELNLTALQVQLEEFGKHNIKDQGQGQWKGAACGRLYLRGRGTDLHGLEGHGQLDVPQGQMYNLPLLLDLLKVLGLRPPDRTAFEEAHATFSIKGPRVFVSRLDLDGNAISLSGQGELNLDGSDIHLDFYAVWGRIKQVLPALVRDLPPAVGKQLLRIKMRGSIHDVKVTKEPIPILVEPMERLLKRLSRG